MPPWLQLFDVTTDYLFIFAMIGENDGGAFTSLITVAATSACLSLVVNGLLTGFVVFRERRHKLFAAVRALFSLFVADRCACRLKPVGHRGGLSACE